MTHNTPSLIDLVKERTDAFFVNEDTLITGEKLPGTPLMGQGFLSKLPGAAALGAAFAGQTSQRRQKQLFDSVHDMTMLKRPATDNTVQYIQEDVGFNAIIVTDTDAHKKLDVIYQNGLMTILNKRTRVNASLFDDRNTYTAS